MEPSQIGATQQLMLSLKPAPHEYPDLPHQRSPSQSSSELQSPCPCLHLLVPMYPRLQHWYVVA